MTETNTSSGVRVLHPDDVDVSSLADVPAGLARGTSFTRAASGDDWASLLAEAGFEHLDTLAFEPRAPGLRRAPGVTAGATTVDVPVPAQAGAVLLVELDGLYHWTLPSEDIAGGGDLRRPGGGRAKRFVLGPVAQSAVRGGAGARGPIFDWIVSAKPFRAIVLRFALGRAEKALAAWIDGDGPFGLCDMSHYDAGLWRAGTAVPLAMGEGSARVLLFVHGTFSSTRGSFGDLLAQPRGRDFLDQARRRYGLVLGFDHKTLALSTTDNARDLADALESLSLPPGTTMDAIAYSRGGLVLRGLVEREFAAGVGKLNLTPGKMIFVGCTNGGTHLADPANWGALTDLYTTLSLTAATATAAIPGVGTVTRFGATAVPIIGRFVQLMAEAGIRENMLPGLASMDPDGELVAALNAAAGRPVKLRYSAITSDFEPGAPGQPNSSPAFWALRQLTADLFKVNNDLVVDTASMSTFWSGAELDDVDNLGATNQVYHTCYFYSEKVAGHLQRWLAPAPGELVASAEEGEKSEAAIRESAVRSPAFRTRGGPAIEASIDADRAEMAGLPRRGAPHVEAEKDKVSEPDSNASETGTDIRGTLASFDIAATMPPEVRIKSQAVLQVIVSRGRIVVQAGDTTKRARMELIASEPLSLRVLALANCAIVEKGAYVTSSSRVIALPQAGANRIEKFSVRGGNAAGPARVVISALQGGKSVAEIELEPRIVANLNAELSANASVFIAASPSQSALTLRIYETKVGDSWRLRFVADCPDADINLDYSSDLTCKPAEYADQRFAEIERIVASSGGFDSALARLRDHGADMGKFMIPEEVRDAIWANRARLAAIQIISDETPVPWELACVRGPDRADKIFLAEFGLVRWMKNVSWPPNQLRLRPDAIRFLAPNYQKPDWALPGAQQEIKELQQLFPGATSLNPSFADVSKFLGGTNAIDALHVACHGAATGNAIQVAGLYLSENLNDLLDISTVRQNFCVTEDSRPIVFLNACQVGRPGAGISGVDGFAQAFLSPESRMGAAVLVAPLWSVGDLNARTFAKVFYEQLIAGAALVDAVREARAQAKGKSELTWLSYAVYGDPFARVADV